MLRLNKGRFNLRWIGILLITGVTMFTAGRMTTPNYAEAINAMKLAESVMKQNDTLLVVNDRLFRVCDTYERITGLKIEDNGDVK